MTPISMSRIVIAWLKQQMKVSLKFVPPLIPTLITKLKFVAKQLSKSVMGIVAVGWEGWLETILGSIATKS